MTSAVTFTSNIVSGIAPATVQFTNTSDISKSATYLWHFGDFTTSTEENPTHTYQASGNYAVYLVINLSGRKSSSDVHYIGIVPGPVNVTYSVASEITNRRFFDNAGNPLAGGLVNSYSSEGYSSKLPIYSNYLGAERENPIVLDSSGAVPGQVYIKTGTTHNYVVTSSDGETVIETIRSAVASSVNPGDHIYFESPDTGVGNVTVSCIYPEPLPPMGSTYMWWITNSYQANFNGYPNGPGYAAQKLPVTLGATPDVYWVQDDNAYRFNRAGSYRVITNTVFSPIGSWPGQNAVFGTIVGGSSIQSQNIQSYESRYGDGEGDGLPSDEQSAGISDTYTVSVAAGDEIYVNYYAQDPYNDSSNRYNFYGTVIMNWIGNDYDSPPTPPVPNASFTSSVSSGESPLGVRFTDTSTASMLAPITSWWWDFNDGNYSNEQNPYNLFYASSNTTFNVSLTVSNRIGSNTATNPIDVTVTPPPPPTPGPTPSFTASPTSGIRPLTVAFIDTSTGNPTSWSWAFGDGTYSANANVTHTYTSIGTFDPMLTVSNSFGSNTAGNVSITVTNPPPIVSSFVANVTPGTTDHVTFIDTSVGSVDYWTWTLTDADGHMYQFIYTPTSPGPLAPTGNYPHNFASNNAGTYRLELEATSVYLRSLGIGTIPAYCSILVEDQWQAYLDFMPGTPYALYLESAWYSTVNRDMAYTDVANQLDALGSVYISYESGPAPYSTFTWAAPFIRSGYNTSTWTASSLTQIDYPGGVTHVTNYSPPGQYTELPGGSMRLRKVLTFTF